MSGDSSFLPEDYLEKRAQRRTNLISLTLFVVVMGGVIAAFFVTDKQRVEVAQMQQVVNKQFEDAAKRLDQLEQLQARKEEMIRKAQVTSSLIEKVPRSMVMSELINNMPGTLSLLEFTLDTKVHQTRAAPARSSLAQAKRDRAAKAKAGTKKPDPLPNPTDVTINLVGVAPTDVEVAQFMGSLQSTSLYDDINLVFSEEIRIDDQVLRKFRIEMRLIETIDLTDYQPKHVKRGLKVNPMASEVQIGANGKLISPKGDVTPVTDRK